MLYFAFVWWVGWLFGWLVSWLTGRFSAWCDEVLYRTRDEFELLSIYNVLEDHIVWSVALTLFWCATDPLYIRMMVVCLLSLLLMLMLMLVNFVYGFSCLFSLVDWAIVAFPFYLTSFHRNIEAIHVDDTNGI